VKNQFGIYLSEQETKLLINYLDADNSGDIDFQEFSKKVTLYDLS
jgi:Ca2+-binding EF-hand superfamily protein